MKKFPDLESKPSFSDIENEILEFWKRMGLFKKALKKIKILNMYFMMDSICKWIAALWTFIGQDLSKI